MSKPTGPFGLYMGAPASDFELEPWPITACYRILNVPRPHPEFELYVGRFVESYGLSFLSVNTETFVCDDEGVILRQRFYDLVQRLEKKYGPAEITDQAQDFFLDEDFNELELSHDPEDWMWELSEHHRLLIAGWDNLANDPNGQIQHIGLAANADSTDEGSVNLSYIFANDADAIEHHKKVAQQNQESDDLFL